MKPVPPAPAPRQPSPAVRVFASVSGAVPAGTRRARLAEFPDTFSETEVSALTNFLASPESRIPGVPPRDALSLKNEAANELLSRAPGGFDLPSFFAAQFLDRSNFAASPVPLLTRLSGVWRRNCWTGRIAFPKPLAVKGRLC